MGLDSMQWALDRGIVGLLALCVCVLAAVVVYFQRRAEALQTTMLDRVQELHDARMADMKTFTAQLQVSNDRVHQTMDAMKNYAEMVDRKSHRTRDF